MANGGAAVQAAGLAQVQAAAQAQAQAQAQAVGLLGSQAYLAAAATTHPSAIAVSTGHALPQQSFSMAQATQIVAANRKRALEEDTSASSQSSTGSFDAAHLLSLAAASHAVSLYQVLCESIFIGC